MTATAPARRWKLGWRWGITVLGTLAILGLLVRDFGGSGDFLRAAATARPSWVALAFAMATACLLLGTLRWILVLRGMGHALGFRRALEVVLATWPLAVVTPSRANDLLRPFAVRAQVPLAAGAGSVLAEKAIDLFLLLALAALGAAVAGLWAWAAFIGAALIAESGVIALVARRRAWLAAAPLVRRRPQTVEELFAALSALWRAPGQLASVVAVSLIIRVLTVGVTHALLVSVGADVPLVLTLMLWPAAMLVGVMPLTLGGMGTRDATFLALLAARGAHVEPATVLVATVGYSVVAIWSFAVIGLPFMARETLARKA